MPDEDYGWLGLLFGICGTLGLTWVAITALMRYVL